MSKCMELAPMDKVPSKTFKFGNTTVIIYSPLVNMTEEERIEYFESERKKGNPVIKQIDQCILDCYKE